MRLDHPLGHHIAGEQRHAEDEHEDRARAGPQSHGDDRRQSALPAAAAGELLRIGSMRMTAVIVMRVRSVRMGFMPPLVM